MTSVNGQAYCLINRARCSSVRLFLCLLFSHLVLSLLFQYSFIRLRNLTFFLYSSLPSLSPHSSKLFQSLSHFFFFSSTFSPSPPHLVFHPLPSLILLCYYFPFFLPHSSVHLISLSFILPSFLPSFLPSSLPSFPSLFFPLFACIRQHPTFLLSPVLLFASVFSVYSVASYSFLLSFLTLTFIIASLLYSVISRQHINCAI